MVLAPLDFSVLTYPEWIKLCVAMSSALGSAREYAMQDPAYDGWADEALDIHYDLVSLTGKPHAPEPGEDGGRLIAP